MRRRAHSTTHHNTCKQHKDTLTHEFSYGKVQGGYAAGSPDLSNIGTFPLFTRSSYLTHTVHHACGLTYSRTRTRTRTHAMHTRTHRTNPSSALQLEALVNTHTHTHTHYTRVVSKIMLAHTYTHTHIHEQVDFIKD